MSLKLAPVKPDDRYVRMHFVFVRKDEGYHVETRTEEQADDATGWIDLWAEDAKACKEPLKRIAGRLYVLQERRDKRKAELSDDKAVAELEEYNRLLTEGLAYRTKAWRLINTDGVAVEAPLTFENAKAVYGDDDHNLRGIAQEFLKDRENFPLRASVSS